MDDASLSKTRRCTLPTLMATVAIAFVAGCSTYIGTTPRSFLREARENVDPNIRYIAYAKLGTPSIYENEAQRDEAVKLLITKLKEAKEPVAVRAVIIRSLGNLGDRRARHEIIKAVNDVENAVIRVEACRALGKVGKPEDATLLARIMTVDKLEDCRIAAIEGLGVLKANDPRIYAMLLDGMENDDPAIRLECLRSLRAITGKDLGTDPAAWRRDIEPKIREMAAVPSPEAAAAARVTAPATTANPR
jgi:HEAT repeat protein